MKINSHRKSGLTIVEVCIVVAVIAILASLLIPAVTHCGPSAERMACVNNLKQIGLAYRLSASDYGGQYPFASTNAAGSLAFANSPEVFRHYAVISNELNTPKVLVCPNDPRKRKATDFVKFVA